MQSSFSTFATLKSQLSHEGSSEDPQILEAAKTRDALMYSIESMDKLDSGKEKNSAALKFLEELAAYSTAIEA
jgi:hypothetical protein